MIKSELLRTHDKHSRTITLDPPKDVKATHSLIFLHGLGDSAEGLEDLFNNAKHSPLTKTTRVRLLTAPEMPVTINMGMKSNSWFDIKDGNWTEDSVCKKEVKSNTDLLWKTIEEEITLHGGDSSKVFIGGFSQGCCMSLHAGLSYPKPLGGIIALSGVLFPFSQVVQEGVPILASHGTHDYLIPCTIAEKSYERVKARKNFKWAPVPGLGHSIDKHTIHLIKEFWTTYAN